MLVSLAMGIAVLRGTAIRPGLIRSGAILMISCIGARQRGQAIPFFFSQGATIHPQDSYSPFRINSPPSQRFRFITAVSHAYCPCTPDRHYLQGHRFDAETARLV